MISRLNTQLANINITQDLNALHVRIRSFDEEVNRLLEKHRVSHATNDSQREKKEINYEYIKNFRYQKVLPLIWVYEDLSGRKMNNPMGLVKTNTAKELFALFSKEKLPILVEYLSAKENELVPVENNAFKIAVDHYAYYFILHVKMFNRDFYFDIGDYTEKMHSINVLEFY